MASDPVSAIIKHLRADASFTAIIASAQINPWISAGSTLPALAVVTSGGPPDPSGVDTQIRISFIVESATRAAVISAHSYLRGVFHNKAGYTIGASPQTCYCLQSSRTSAVDVLKRDDNGAWEGQAFYEFQIVES